MTIIKCEKIEKGNYALEFSVDKATFEAAISKVYHQQVKNINVPGFRKGKAPRSIIERMYGKGVFYEDAANLLLPETYEAVLAEKQLTPATRAQFDIVSIDENGIVFSAIVPVKPEIIIEGYKGIEASREPAPVSEEEIDREISVVRQRNSRELEVTDAPAEMGNTVVIDFEGSVDGVLFEGGAGTDYSLNLGSGSFIPGFEEQIAGHNIGEEFVVSVTFPEDYHAEELAGKAAEFKTTIKAIKKIELPELDDDFAKDVSEFDTLAEYRADIEAKILKRHEDSVEANFENTIIEALLGKMGGDEIPEALFVEEQENQLRDFDNRLRSQGLDLATYAKYTGQDLDALRNQMRPQAENFVKIRLTLEKIADLEGIQVSDEDLEAEYGRLAESYKMEIDQLKNMLPATSLVTDLRVQRAMALVKENAVAPAKAE